MGGEVGTVEGEEESGCSDDQEQGDIEDASLSSHHNSSVAVERVLSREYFPFSNYFWHCVATGTLLNQLLY